MNVELDALGDDADADRARPLRDELDRLRESVEEAEGVLLCLDFDGTLAPIVDDPADAAVPAASASALSALAGRPTVDLAVVSGREVSDVRERVGLDGIAYAGNHGLERWHDGVRTPHPEAEHRRGAVAAACESIRDRLTDVPGTRVEDKGLTATVHHRLADHAGAEAARTATRDAADAADLVWTRGRGFLELGPDLQWDTGRAVRELQPFVDDRLVVYVGDDTTDEDAFEAVAPSGVAIQVGDGRDTAADYRLDDPEAVAAFLSWLLEATDPADSAVTRREAPEHPS